MLPLTLLPAPYNETAFIAGGYAACPGLAEDIDVWCPVDLTEPSGGLASNPFEVVWNERDRVVKYLRAQFGEAFIEQDGVGTPRDRTKLQTTFEGYNLPIPIRRAGSVTLEGCSLPYHIICVGGDVDEVLSSFDISTHAIALTPKGVVKDANWTPPMVEPKILLHKYTSAARFEKIRMRYLMGGQV